ncbi:MAG: N-(5'-phosphoribosyl)anthranilate isomerase [Syntrophorhabdus sp. PtaU1.Bin153]|nr:MAG: N-(5'-phosphoribosyl)anthranilate isomerase [Syntrophorhabdus sp. PtaU1.Bin153]
MRVRIKICGITNAKDAFLAADLGAYAVGFVFYKGSERYVSYDDARKIAQKLPPFVVRVGVFVNEKPENMLAAKDHCLLDRVQVHSDQVDKGQYIIPGITIMAYRVKDEKDIEAAKQSPAFPLLDSHVESMYGGSGSSFNWHLLKDFGRPYILAGGINSENIDEALGFEPYAIDIASGVEMRPGVKDPRKMRDIFDKVQG